MEFLGVGYQEIAVILVLALIFVGPERLPAVAYQIGRAVREMQKYARAVRNEFRDEFDYIEDQYKTIKGEIDETRVSMKEQERQLNAELREASAPLTDAVKEADAAVKASPNGAGKAANGAKPAGVDETPTEKPPLVF